MGSSASTNGIDWWGDFPVRLPMLDIHTVGAGGGSIAYGWTVVGRCVWGRGAAGADAGAGLLWDW